MTAREDPPAVSSDGASAGEPLAGGEGAAQPAAEPVPQSEGRPEAQGRAFVRGFVDTAAGRVPRVATGLAWNDAVDRWRTRWRVRRPADRVSPGLYAVGSPWDTSPVLVTANAKSTFDALRSSLARVDAWVLVVDTGGLGVWSAACEGTFAVRDVARQVEASGLERVVSHRTLVLPQRAAAGVAAHLLPQACGFSAVFGPVRASDVAGFLAAGNVATPSMRESTFDWGERLALVPAEVVGKLSPSRLIVPLLLVAGALGPGFFSVRGALVRGSGAVLAYVVGVASGSVVTPLLLPWLPGRLFAYKGALVGAAAALVCIARFGSRLGWADCAALVPAVAVTSSWCAMVFAGAAPFTSPSGLEKEMRAALPYQVGGLLAAALLWIGSRF